MLGHQTLITSLSAFFFSVLVFQIQLDLNPIANNALLYGLSRDYKVRSQSPIYCQGLLDCGQRMCEVYHEVDVAHVVLDPLQAEVDCREHVAIRESWTIFLIITIVLLTLSMIITVVLNFNQKYRAYIVSVFFVRILNILISVTLWAATIFGSGNVLLDAWNLPIFSHSLLVAAALGVEINHKEITRRVFHDEILM